MRSYREASHDPTVPVVYGIGREPKVCLPPVLPTLFQKMAATPLEMSRSGGGGACNSHEQRTVSSLRRQVREYGGSETCSIVVLW